jgi:hypothetical protein
VLRTSSCARLRSDARFRQQRKIMWTTQTWRRELAVGDTNACARNGDKDSRYLAGDMIPPDAKT